MINSIVKHDEFSKNTNLVVSMNDSPSFVIVPGHLGVIFILRRFLIRLHLYRHPYLDVHHIRGQALYVLGNAFYGGPFKLVTRLFHKLLHAENSNLVVVERVVSSVLLSVVTFQTIRDWHVHGICA